MSEGTAFPPFSRLKSATAFLACSLAHMAYSAYTEVASPAVAPAKNADWVHISTLFVGIDVSSKSNVVFAMDFDENKFISSSFRNNQPGADEPAGMILDCMVRHPNLNTIVVAMDKTDPLDAYLIADFARVGRTKKCEPWRGAQFLALKRLTRHRLHLAEYITREKTYMVSNLYLKFSELQLFWGCPTSVVSPYVPIALYFLNNPFLHC